MRPVLLLPLQVCSEHPLACRVLVCPLALASAPAFSHLCLLPVGAGAAEAQREALGSALADVTNLVPSLHGQCDKAQALSELGSEAAAQLQALAAARLAVLRAQRPAGGAEAEGEQLAAWVLQLKDVAVHSCVVTLQQPGGEALVAVLLDSCAFLLQQAQRGQPTARDDGYLAAHALEVICVGGAPGGLPSPRQLALGIEAAGVAFGAAAAQAGLDSLAMLAGSVVQKLTDWAAACQLSDSIGSFGLVAAVAAESALGTAEAAIRLAAQIVQREGVALAAGRPHIPSVIDSCVQAAFSLLRLAQLQPRAAAAGLATAWGMSGGQEAVTKVGMQAAYVGMQAGSGALNGWQLSSSGWGLALQSRWCSGRC